MTPVTIKSSATGWYDASSTNFWTARCLWDTGSALYAVTQDSGGSPHVRVLKADSRTAPTSFSEQDSGNNKAVTNATYPYSSWYDGTYIHVAVFTATNTITHYLFDPSTDLWTTGLGNADTAFSNAYGIRVVHNTTASVTAIWGISSSDDADVRRARYSGGSWSTFTQAALSSSNASHLIDAVADSAGFEAAVWRDAAASDITYGTVSSVPASASTDVDTSAGTASQGGRFNLYDDGGTDKIVIAYVTSTGILQERICSLEAGAAAGRLTAEATIESTASNVGTRTPVSTAMVNGSTLYCAWWDDANSGTIKYSTKPSSWNAATDFATEVTNLIEVVPVGIGLAVVYQSGSDIVLDWIVSPAVGDTGTVSAGSLSVSGQSIAGRSGVLGSLSAGSLSVSGQSITGSVAVPAVGTIASGSLVTSGQSIAARSGVVGSIAAGSLVVSGQSHLARSGVIGTVSSGSMATSGQSIIGLWSDIGSIVSGALVVTGQSIVGTATGGGGDTGVISSGALVIAGQSISARAGVLGSIVPATLVVSGQSMLGIWDADGIVSAGLYAVSGQSLSARSGVVGSVSSTALLISGQSISGRSGVLGLIGNGTLTISGQSIAARSGVLGLLSSGSMAVSGQGITGIWSSLGSITPAAMVVSGQALTGAFGVVGVIASGAYGVTGQSLVSGYGMIGAIATGSYVVSGQSISSRENVTSNIVPATLLVDGQDIGARVGVVAVITTGDYIIIGNEIVVTIGLAFEPDLDYVINVIMPDRTISTLKQYNSFRVPAKGFTNAVEPNRSEVAVRPFEASPRDRVIAVVRNDE